MLGGGWRSTAIVGSGWLTVAVGGGDSGDEWWWRQRQRQGQVCGDRRIYFRYIYDIILDVLCD